VRQENRAASELGSAPTVIQFTPIWISKRTRTLLILSGLVALVLLMWYSPLDTWVSISSITPYLGAALGAISAVVLALFESPTTALLTPVVFVSIQLAEVQHSDASASGTHFAGPLDPDLPGRHSRGRDRGSPRHHLRRADRGRLAGALRFVPRSLSHQELA
jgi:hypothetical protein